MHTTKKLAALVAVSCMAIATVMLATWPRQGEGWSDDRCFSASLAGASRDLLIEHGCETARVVSTTAPTLVPKEQCWAWEVDMRDHPAYAQGQAKAWQENNCQPYGTIR